MGGRGIQVRNDNAQIKMSEYLQWLDIKGTKELWDDYRARQDIGSGVSSQAMRKKCACCLQYSLPAFSEYEQCPICGWIDDPIQNSDHTSTSGCNSISLQDARKLWAENSRT